MEQQEEKSKIANSKLEEYSKKIEQLEELICDGIHWNARSATICGIKFNLCNERSWNDTENVLEITICLIWTKTSLHTT